MPDRISKLPIAKNGYPTPFFVQELNGCRDDFRVADSRKMRECMEHRLCWVCGEPCGIYLAYVIGPMCVINRISADPGMHLDCALWSVRACPFMVRPNMVRREDELTKGVEDQRGIMITRNPGVMALWIAKSHVVEMSRNGPLFRLGEPVALSFWREGREATKAEIMEAVNTGLPFLRETCESPTDHKALDQHIKDAMPLFDRADHVAA